MSETGHPVEIHGLPGGDLFSEGLADLREGRDTTSAALVRMAAPRLRDIGFDVPAAPAGEPAGHRLYDLLAAEHSTGAHSRYNALVRRMVKFAAAAERAHKRLDAQMERAVGGEG